MAEEERRTQSSGNKRTKPSSSSSSSQQAHGPSLREEKRRKWQVKQEKNRQQQQQHDDDDDSSIVKWCKEHSTFARLVTEQDVTDIRNGSSGENVNTHIDDLPLHLAPFWNLQDSTKIDHSTEGKRLFIAEGTETIRILLQQQKSTTAAAANKLGLDPIELRSIFVKPSILLELPVRLVTDVEAVTDKDISTGNDYSANKKQKFRVLVGRSEDVLSGVAGFPVKRGALACGVCPTDRTEAWLHHYMSQRLQAATPDSTAPLRILALDGICDTANLGSMIRTASVLGVQVVVVSHHTCEVWYRRTIRVSMGHVFLVPVVRVSNLAAWLTKWGQDDNSNQNLTSYAAVVKKDDNTLTLDQMPSASVPSAWCCVMGNEGNGISKQVLEACSKRLRIDMAEGVDSLSVPIATGILLHGLREREKGG
jgi:tRNA G18 (ribose-2'-O)-methylase SpoU